MFLIVYHNSAGGPCVPASLLWYPFPPLSLFMFSDSWMFDPFVLQKDKCMEIRETANLTTNLIIERFKEIYCHICSLSGVRAL